MKIELTQALKYKDAELKELELDLNSLRGYEMLDAEEDLRRQGISIGAWDYSRPYMIQVASRAMHIPVEVLKGLSAKDFIRVCNEVMRFLLEEVSEDLTVRNSEKQ